MGIMCFSIEIHSHSFTANYSRHRCTHSAKTCTMALEVLHMLPFYEASVEASLAQCQWLFIAVLCGGYSLSLLGPCMALSDVLARECTCNRYSTFSGLGNPGCFQRSSSPNSSNPDERHRWQESCCFMWTRRS